MFTELLKKYDLKPYRLKQINQAVFRDLVGSWEEITTLPVELRDRLNKEVQFCSLRPVKELTSKNKDTVKILLACDDGAKIESVLMMHEGRNTICISSQVGCPLGCRFCATGRMGLKRNLSTREIIDQVLWWARYLKPDGKKINNIVFMGMGEPMLNIDNVSAAIDILTDDALLGMGKRKITISTAGLIKPLQNFLQNYPHIGLAISLHAPNQELREEIMPGTAPNNQIEELIRVAREYSQQTKRRVSFEYILIEGVNDSLEQAQELGDLIEGDYLYHVNLIPYNPDATGPAKWKRPNSFRVNRFRNELKKLGVPVSVRTVMGDDIGAACGQLRNM